MPEVLPVVCSVFFSVSILECDVLLHESVHLEFGVQIPTDKMQ